MADYDWFDRDLGPSADMLDARKYRPLGFEAVWDYGTTTSMRPKKIQYYLCRRGCGTLVWEPEIHMKNVCTTFEPVVSTSTGH